MKISLHFLFLFITISAFAQSERKLIYGKILADSTTTSSIHIINRTTNIGTLSNQYGEFKIAAKENDTLVFSAIQLELKELIITKKHLKEILLTVRLKAAVNNLNEVTVRNHNLTGSLTLDIQHIKLKDHVDEFTLNLPNAGKAPVTEVDRIKLRFGQYSGIVGALYGWISGEKKKLKKLEKLETEKLYLNKIRSFIKDTFFISELKIPKNKIQHFLEFSKSKNIIDLYKKGNQNEVIEILMAESSIYLEYLKNEN